jgi:hypothetical protein
LNTLQQDPKIDDRGYELKWIDMKSNFVQIWFTGQGVRHFEGEPQEQKVFMGQVPHDQAIGGPASQALIAGVGKQCMCGKPWNEEANVLAPKGTEFGLQRGLNLGSRR